MTTVNDIYNYLCLRAPLELQMDFDNSGFQMGIKNTRVEKVLLVLDITDKTVDEAIELDADLIISHHPLFFRPVKCIDGSVSEGERIVKLIKNDISVISMHTNLDIAEGGVNDVLIRLLGAQTDGALDADGCGRTGRLGEKMSLTQFLEYIKKTLNCSGLRYYDAGKAVEHIAVMGGAGSGALEDAWKKGCDTYVTADISYHYFLRAEELGINIIDADHFCTENPIMPQLQKELSEKFDDVEFVVSGKHKQIVSFA